MLTAGQILSLTIEKPAAGGRMIARVDGQVVLVGGAIPGERVRARIERVSKGVAFAETIAVEEPSPIGATAFADPLCGGCLYAPHRVSAAARDQGPGHRGCVRADRPPGVAVRRHASRRRRRTAIACARGCTCAGSRFGFFREGTHDLCDARATRQLLPATCDALDRLAPGIRSLGIDAVREIELSENVDADRARRPRWMPSRRAGRAGGSRVRSID